MRIVVERDGVLGTLDLDRVRGPKGDDAPAPTEDFLRAIIEPLIPEPIKGDPGEDVSDERLLGLIRPLIPAPVKGNKGDAPTAGELLSLIRPLIPPRAEDGRTPTDGELLALIRPLIPAPVPPSEEELLKLIKPLIPAPIKGDAGKDIELPPGGKPYTFLGYSGKGKLEWRSPGGGGGSLVQRRQLLELTSRVVALETSPDGGGGGAAAVWGAIGGMLSSQVDLQAALDGKEPVGALAVAIGYTDAAFVAHLASPNPHPQYVMHCELPSGFTQVEVEELARDAVGLALFNAESENWGIIVELDDAGEVITLKVDSGMFLTVLHEVDPTAHFNLFEAASISAALYADALMLAHEAAPNPHPQYVLHCELTTFEALGTAAALITVHEQAANPHPQYVMHCELPSGSGPASTDELPEGLINLYFTNVRAVAAFAGDPNPFPQYVLQCEFAPSAPGALATGTATIDFGAFPGRHEATADVTGQAGLISTTRIWAWVQPIATADHSADEHIAANIQVIGYYQADGTLRICGQALPHLNDGRRDTHRQPDPARLHGLFTVGWGWTN